MSIHIQTGTGSPITNNMAGTPGCHYIDLATGDHYLYGIDTWQMIGSGGAPAMSVFTQDASIQSSLALDFTHSDFVLYNAPSTGNIELNMTGVDGDNISIGQATITVLSPTPVAVAGGTGGAFISLHDGVTFTSGMLAQPAGALGMLLRVKQLGFYPEHSGNMVIIEASALTAQTAYNV